MCLSNFSQAITRLSWGLAGAQLPQFEQLVSSGLASFFFQARKLASVTSKSWHVCTSGVRLYLTYRIYDLPFRRRQRLDFLVPHWIT
jgi:hypothetical protein